MEAQRRRHPTLTTDDARAAAHFPVFPTGVDSPRSKLVYLYLSLAAPATPTDLRDVLGITSLDLYPILSWLEERDVVVCVDGLYRAASGVDTD